MKFKKGHKVPKSWRIAVSKAHKGKPKPRNKEWQRNNTLSILKSYKKGRKPVFLGRKRPEHSRLMKKYYKSGRLKPIRMFGKNNPSWKGNNIGYNGLHAWIRKELGQPNKCVICGIKKARYEWARIKKCKKRNVKNWISVCLSCHRYIDGNGRSVKNMIKRLEILKEKYNIKIKKITTILNFYEQW